MIKNFIKKHPSSWRYISVIVILIIILPTIFAVAFGGVIGAGFGMGIFILLAMFGLYEVFSNMEMSKFSVIFLALTPLILFLFTTAQMSPVDHFKDIADSNQVSHPDPLLSFRQIVHGSLSWQNLTLLFLVTFLPIIIDPKIRNSGKAVYNQIIITIVVVTFAAFTKLAWIMNVYNYIWLFFFLSIAIVADTFAYLGGKYLGKHFFNGAKLAPKLSPKKTWGGFIIGFILSASFVVGLGWYLDVFKHAGTPIAVLISATILLPLISPIGDLFYSGVKRYLGIKDFSNLMPGHGGVLDRLDAISFVMFLTVVLFYF